MSQPLIAGEEFDRLWREEFNECCNDVREEMQQARANAKNGAQIVSYSQGQHSAITLQFAAHKALFMVLFRIHKQERDKLEARIADLEDRPELKDAGPWQEGKQYSKGEIVSYQGSAWICRKDTTTRPAGSQSWRLLVKRVKDAAK